MKRLLTTLPVILASGILAYYFRNAGLFDPDRYFHFALSREISTSGGQILRTLSGPVGLGWDKFFPEKEFLFHVFTGTAYRFGAETGVQFLIGLFFIAFNIITFSTLKKLWSTQTAYVTFFLLLPTQTHILLRMNYLRPHTFAITLFFVLVLCLVSDLKHKNYLTFAICTLFALSYHAFYLLFPVLGVYFLLTQKQNRKDSSNLITLGILGLAVGIILNPYFPGNIEMSIRHLLIALFETKNSNLNFGQELIPWRSDVLLRQGFWALLGLGSAKIFHDQKKATTPNWRFEFVWILATFFWVLTLLNPRAQELAIPLTFISMGQIFSEFSNLKTKCAVLLATLAVAMPAFIEIIKVPAPPDQHLVKYIDFMKNRPEENIRVFNADWDMSPYIMYAKPSFKFIDLLDPSFLYVKNRDLHEAREKLNSGLGVDPYNLVRATFNADWIETRSPILIRQLEREPDFVRIYPDKYSNSDIDGNNPFIFSLSNKKSTHFIHKYRYTYKKFEKNWDTHDYLNWKPAFNEKNLETIDLTKIGNPEFLLPFFDFLKVLKEKTKRQSFEPGVHCTYLQPEFSKNDLKENYDILGFGGGRIIRLWFDDQPVLITDKAYDAPRLIQGFVKLRSRISTNSKIEAIVCSSDESNYMGFSLSLWNAKKIEEDCKMKHAYLSTYLPSKTKFKETNMPSTTCFAPFSYTRQP